MLKGVVDLKGKCIGIMCGLIGYFVMLKVFDVVGLLFDVVLFCFLLLVDMMLVFVIGLIDVWVIWEFYIVFVEMSGCVCVLVNGCGLWLGFSYFVVIDVVIVLKCDVLYDFL